MARRKRHSRKHSVAGKCRIVTMRGGHKRRICWSAKGKIKSNTRVR
jgi:hypothetical protein